MSSANPTQPQANRWQRGVQIFNYPLISVPFVLCTILMLLSVGLSVVRTFVGLGFTGMNDHYAWGVWKTFNVMTLTALGSGGLAVGLFAWVGNRKQLHVVMRTALATSLLFYSTGMIALTFDVGRPWNLYNLMMPWRWNGHSALLEVAACMTAYVTIFLLYENLPPILDRLYVTGDANRRAMLDRIMPRIRKLYPYMIAAAYVLPMMHQSSLGGLMVIAGTKVHPLWQTQTLPLLYLLQAVACGFGAVIVILMMSSLAWRRSIDIPILSDLVRYMSWTSVVFVAVRWLDAVVRGVIGMAFEANRYALGFHVENALVLVPAILFLASPRIRSTARAIYALTIVATFGGLVYRFAPTTLAYRTGVQSYYFPSIAELFMCLGYISLAVILYIVAAKKFAILPAPVSHWYASVKFEKAQNPNLRINEHGAATDY